MMHQVLQSIPRLATITHLPKTISTMGSIRFFASSLPPVVEFAHSKEQRLLHCLMQRHGDKKRGLSEYDKLAIEQICDKISQKYGIRPQHSIESLKVSSIVCWPSEWIKKNAAEDRHRTLNAIIVEAVQVLVPKAEVENIQEIFKMLSSEEAPKKHINESQEHSKQRLCGKV